jgi:hypothetical protein
VEWLDQFYELPEIPYDFTRSKNTPPTSTTDIPVRYNRSFELHTIRYVQSGTVSKRKSRIRSGTKEKK